MPRGEDPRNRARPATIDKPAGIGQTNSLAMASAELGQREAGQGRFVGTSALSSVLPTRNCDEGVRPNRERPRLGATIAMHWWRRTLRLGPAPILVHNPTSRRGPVSGETRGGAQLTWSLASRRCGPPPSSRAWWGQCWAVLRTGLASGVVARIHMLRGGVEIPASGSNPNAGLAIAAAPLERCSDSAVGSTLRRHEVVTLGSLFLGGSRKRGGQHRESACVAQCAPRHLRRRTCVRACMRARVRACARVRVAVVSMLIGGARNATRTRR